jgi:hypothetical protein
MLPLLCVLQVCSVHFVTSRVDNARELEASLVVCGSSVPWHVLGAVQLHSPCRCAGPQGHTGTGKSLSAQDGPAHDVCVCVCVCVCVKGCASAQGARLDRQCAINPVPAVSTKICYWLQQHCLVALLPAPCLSQGLVLTMCCCCCCCPTWLQVCAPLR